MASLSFYAESDIVADEFISSTAYVLDTFDLTDIRLDRFVFDWGKEEDCETIFKEYLIDDEAYLSAFDDEITPTTKALKLGNESFSAAFTALDFVEEADELAEYMDGIKEMNSSIKDSLGEVLENQEIKSADIVEAGLKMFDYWYTYSKQIDDHRKMLGAVYGYNPQDKKSNHAAYRAAYSVQKLYGSDTAKRLEESLQEAAQDLTLKLGQDTIKNNWGLLLAPYTFTTHITKFIVPQAFETIENDALLYVIDASTQKAVITYLAMRYSDKYDEKSLENLRLCAIMAMVSSKHAYITLWPEGYEHEHLEGINDALQKLYLAADGVACDSSDYYEKKRDEIRDNMSYFHLGDAPNGIKSRMFTEEEAIVIARWNVCGTMEEHPEYSFEVEDIFEYNGVKFYPVKVIDKIYSPPQYAVHFFVSIDGIYGMSGNYASSGQANKYDLYECESYFNPFFITEDEAYELAEQYFCDESSRAKYSFLKEDLYVYDGVPYYAIKVSFNYEYHSSYAGVHLFVSAYGDDIVEGTYIGEGRYELFFDED